MEFEAAPAGAVLATYDLEPVEFLGGGHHQNWLCHRHGSNVVLRRHIRPPLGDIRYEHVVADRLAAEGWPVPVLLEEPVTLEGSVWALFRWLPGRARADAGSAEERADRGRLLAELHETTAGMVDLGQRPGCVQAHEVLDDPALDSHLTAYAAWFPREARLMAWHVERARAMFAEVDLERAQRVVLHGDFAPWNLLYESGGLTGIVDFEATHLNFRVADFADSWRGEADEVVLGYDARHRLEDVDWALLTPVYWAWLLIRTSETIKAMIDGVVEPRLLRWPVHNLVKRTPLMGALAVPYTE